MSSPVLRIMALEKKVEELERQIDAALNRASIVIEGNIVPVKRPVGRPPHKGIN